MSESILAQLFHVLFGRHRGRLLVEGPWALSTLTCCKLQPWIWERSRGPIKCFLAFYGRQMASADADTLTWEWSTGEEAERAHEVSLKLFEAVE